MRLQLTASIILLFLSGLSLRAAEIHGTITQRAAGKEQAAIGQVIVGIANGDSKTLSHRTALAHASTHGRIVQLDKKGNFSIKDVPHGKWLYVSVFLEAGYGSYQVVKLSEGDRMDLSQTLPASQAGAVTFKGKLIWPETVRFNNEALLFATLVGTNNSWEYVVTCIPGATGLNFDRIVPGTYRLEISATTEDGTDLHKIVPITIGAAMASPTAIRIP